MPVAIRAITRLQDADDINVTLGAGVDEYALCWDNDTAKFVLRAVAGGVTDHGALTGLTPDDDHTQYALLAGRAGGQTLYGGTAANEDITIHGTSDATRTTSYVILQPTAGRVGIGTTAPSTILHVVGSIVDDLVYFQNTNVSGWNGFSLRNSSNVQVGFFSSGNASAVTWAGQVALGTNGNVPLILATNQIERVRILGSGNVGIGTSAPATLLHVVGAATITAGIRPAADSTTALQLQNASGTSVLNVDTTNARVGIGTTTPAQPLHVSKSVDGDTNIQLTNPSDGLSGRAAMNVTSGTTGAITFGVYAVNSNYTGLTNWSGKAILYGGTNATSLTFISGAAAGRIDFATGGLDPIANLKLTILNSGFVGIGAVAPATRLDIDAGAMTMAEMTAPTGVANKAMLYTKDNGSGKTQLCCKLGDDVEIVLATQA